MLLRRKLLLSNLLVNFIEIAKLLACTAKLSKRLLFQIMISPPDAPIEGEKTKEPKFLGQNFFK